MPHPLPPIESLNNAKDWITAVNNACARHDPQAQELAEQALQAYPREGQLFYLAILAALLAEQPARAHRLLKRTSKHFILDERHHLLSAIALAQQGGLANAAALLRQYGLDAPHLATRWFHGEWSLSSWVMEWLNAILAPPPARKPAPPSRQPAKRAKTAPVTAPPPPAAPAAPPAVPDLPRMTPEIPLRLTVTNAASLRWDAPETADDAFAWFGLRTDYAHVSLLQGFDELLCLPLLHQVDTYWYQVETARKVLKQFRGRVLLADEVGLGKTIEAGMVLKEYLVRGMVERVLILTPASLVGQWQEELATKFDIACATSYDGLLKRDPAAFWAQPRVIASLATARRADQAAHLLAQSYDLVIVDEAHHLKSRTTQNYKLVDAVRKRFLLLLSATPVQNSLVELYNLLTLLKPGIFNTEKEFRAAYMTAGKPRLPANRERMRDLMRDVMIRNTRALVDVRLPARHAVTLRLDASDEERTLYQALDDLVRATHAAAPGQQRLTLHHLLSAAGSCPAAAAAALARLSDADPRWAALQARYAALGRGVKEEALLDLLRRNPAEKVMVFLHHRETLERLATLLEAEGLLFARFDGTLSGPEKDAAIAAFRDEVPVLLCTQSGGEGRNVQFCHTLVNFDLPWNPMVIEQRIGRLHRIGQTQEVFIFNLVAHGTLEDQVLRLLDEKINMFELVVGEVDAILGELDEGPDFADAVFTTWVESSAEARTTAFDTLGARLVRAKTDYEAIKELDEALFGDEFETG
jgi:superfamily II DNA or RNA helicase